MSRSERKAVKRRVKDAAKAEKQANKEFEKNYKALQKRHYKHQQTSREKNFIQPNGKDESVSGREGGHAKDNVRRRMRKGQQKARRNRDGRAIPWWRRVLVEEVLEKGLKGFMALVCRVFTKVRKLRGLGLYLASTPVLPEILDA